MELNERDRNTRDEIERLTKDVAVAAATLFSRLAALECVTPVEIRDCYPKLNDALSVARDVLECCKMPYAIYLQSKRWKQVRGNRIAKDRSRCVDCGETEYLNVHHETYENRGLESLDDLVTLCDECHRKRHGKS